MAVDVWTYRENVKGTDLTGYEVEATDGAIGKVDQATHDVDAYYIVVDTGVWLPLGSRVLLPAGTIERVGAGKVYLNRSKDEIKNAPPFDPKQQLGESQRAMLDSYYRSRFYGQEPWETKPEEPSGHSREQLYEEAKALGIKGRSKMTKDVLRQAIEQARRR